MNKKRVIIIGGGYSVNEGIKQGLWSKIRGEQIWSLNHAFKLMPYHPSKQLWLDYKFFLKNIKNFVLLYKQGSELVTACGLDKDREMLQFLSNVSNQLIKLRKRGVIINQKLIKQVANSFLLKILSKYDVKSQNHYFFGELLGGEIKSFNLIKNLKESKYILICRVKTKKGVIKPPRVYVFSRKHPQRAYTLLSDRIKYLIKHNLQCYLISRMKTYEVTTNKKDYLNNKSMLYAGCPALTGIFALSLAVKLKFNEIFLLGFDFGAPRRDKKSLLRYFNSKIKKFKKGSNIQQDLMRYYEDDCKTAKYVRDFRLFLKKGAKIYNIGLQSNIPYFTKLSYDSFYDLIHKKP